jgi:hypothetical protein
MKMKRFLIISLTLLAFAGCGNGEQPDVPKAPPEDFADERFYTFLLENFDADKDGVISREEANRVRQMDCSSSRFTSLTGIEHFPNLEKLNVEHVLYGGAVDLDLSKNIALTELYATGAGIRTLDVSGCPLLKILLVGDSEIETLDVGNNLQLEILDISHTRIEAIYLGKNIALKELYCAGKDPASGTSGMQMTELDVSANIRLERLDCSGNKLAKIDLAKNPELRDLDISENDIAFLNLTGNNELKKLDISNTQISFLDIKNMAIDTLYCCSGYGYLKTLDAKGSRTLKMLECNYVERLDVSESSVETIVFYETECSYGNPPIQEMTFLLNGCPNLKEYCYRLTGLFPRHSEEVNSGHIHLDISNCPSLSKFYSNALADIKINNCPELKELTCKGAFENLDLSDNTHAETVYCHSPLLKTIDLTSCTLLEDLYCYGGFASVDFSGNKNIKRLKLVSRELTSLNIDALTGLKYLSLAIAPFDATLNITENAGLEELIIRDSADYNTGNMKHLHVSGLPSLKYIKATVLITELEVHNCANLEAISGKSSYDYREIPCKLEIENCSGLRNLFYRFGNLTDIGIRDCGNLDSLDISNNKLTSFQYAGEALTYLNCTGNELTSLDVSGSSGLKELDCKHNAINSLKMDGCAGMEVIDCAENRIPVLTVDGFPKLRDLYCRGNRLTSLDISNNPVMDRIDCSENPDLATIYISRSQNFSMFKKDGKADVIYKD